jgi:hypothetical protein
MLLDVGFLRHLEDNEIMVPCASQTIEYVLYVMRNNHIVIPWENRTTNTSRPLTAVYGNKKE